MSNDNGKAIAVDGSGSVYVAGTFQGTANFNLPSASGSNELVSAGFGDIFIAKFSTSSALLWLRRGGGTDPEDGKAIAVDGGGNVHVTGTFQGTANFNTPSASGSNQLVSAGGGTFSSLNTTPQAPCSGFAEEVVVQLVILASPSP